MAENYQTVIVARQNGITTITFNRPEKRNAMSPVWSSSYGKSFARFPE